MKAIIVKNILIALLVVIAAAGCSTRQPTVASAAHPFTHFIDPVTEEIPNVKIDGQ